MSSLKEKARKLQKRQAKDYDPEDETANVNGEDNEESEDFDEVSGGREHYESVGSSKLRKPDHPQLDKKRYGGVAVSKSRVHEQEYHLDPFAPVSEDEEGDPFAAGEGSDASRQNSDPESSDDEGSGLEEGQDGDAEEQFTSRFSSQSEGDSDDDNLPEASDEDGEEAEDEDEAEVRQSQVLEFRPPRNAKERLRNNLLAESVAAKSLSSAAAAEAQKGQAVKQQQDAYDRLLDARIKLQKAVNTSNDLKLDGSVTDEDAKVAIINAEKAALSLWSTIDSIRCSNINSRSTKKRKLSPLASTDSTDLATMSNHLRNLTTHSTPHIRATLDHWSTRTRASAASSTSNSRLNPSESSELKLTAVLDTYLDNQSSDLVAQSAPDLSTLSYIDTAFYQSLLTDLIASRTNSAATDVDLPTSNMPFKQARQKKQVDTKASKGRKIRYTIHEKLQNFMAPEDRTTWTENARREFFASLFGGQGANFGPEVEHAVMEEASEEQALRLFRS